MECKKDDARKAKEIAERKLTEKDFSGAERFALKAQALYPGTEGLSQLMMIINVYLYAEKKVNKEVDWYGVLGETPSADDETLRKKYLKLALKIHPDKNKCIHADGAFKLVSEAWCLLSDKTKRLAYDQRNFTNTSTNNNVRPPPNSYFSTSCSMCKFPCEHRRIYLNETVRCSNCGKIFKAVETPSPSRPPFDEKRDKNDYFSTSCSMCKFPCEHRRIYLNETVRCSNCGKIFKAVETPSPSRPPFNENGNKNSYFSTSCPTCKFCFKHLRIYVNETVLCSHCGKKFKAAETPSPSWNYHNKSKTADVPLPKMSKTPDVPLPKMSKTLDVPLPKMSPLFFSSSCTGVAKKAAPYVVQQAANNNNTKRARKEEAAQGQRVNKHPKMSSTEELTTPCEMPKTEFHPQTINPVPPGAF